MEKVTLHWDDPLRLGLQLIESMAIRNGLVLARGFNVVASDPAPNAEANLHRFIERGYLRDRQLERTAYENSSERFMKIRMLVIYVFGLSLIGSTWADGLPKMGYTSGGSVTDLVAKGYRWVTVDGPYACANEQEVRKITSSRSDLTELSLVEAGDAYYLIPGTLVRITQDDHVNGMSEILLRGIAKPLWTYAKFLSARPIRDVYGIVETPDTAGLIDAGDAAIARAD